MKLVITEKGSQAKDVAKGLGWKRDGFGYSGTLGGEQAYMLPAKGHLLQPPPPDQLNPDLKWDSLEGLLPVPRLLPMKPSPDQDGTEAQYQPRAYLKRIGAMLAKRPSEVIIATDPDREGEAIGWNILEHFSYQGPVRRAWFAEGVDEASMRKAFAELRAPELSKGWWRASQARASVDYVYQYVVRALTYYARHGLLGDNLGKGRGPASIPSVGRVQTPATCLIVIRELEIQSFRPVDHFTIGADFSLSGEQISGNYDPILSRAIIDNAPAGVHWLDPDRLPGEQDDPEDPAFFEKPLYIDRDSVEAFRQRLLGSADESKIVDVVSRNQKENPPKTFDSALATEAISEATGIDPSLAQTILEDLYEQGWLSYPRTDRQELPGGLYDKPAERRGMIDAVAALPELQGLAQRVRAIHEGEDETYQPFRPAVFSKQEMQHYGLVPTKQRMTQQAFDGLMPKKVHGRTRRPAHTRELMQAAYLIVVKQYLVTMLPPMLFRSTRLEVRVPCPDLLGHASSRFICNGRDIIDLGWRGIVDRPVSDTQLIPESLPGQLAPLREVHLKQSRTKPPKRYKHAKFEHALKNVGKDVKDPELRKLLNSSLSGGTRGLGTPATRNAMRDTSIAREYVTVNSKKELVPLQKGYDLYEFVEDWLRIPETTALWEDFLLKICAQRDDAKAVQMRDAFINKQINIVEDYLHRLQDRFGSDLGPAPSSNPPSPKMVAAIEAICKAKGITPPEKAFESFSVAKTFLQEHPRDNKPTEAQINAARAMLASLSTPPEIDSDVWEDRGKLSQLIDSLKELTPPTPGQLSALQSIASRLGPDEQPPEEAYTKRVVCSAFLDQHMKKGGKKKGSSGGGSARSRTRPGRGGPRRRASSPRV